MTALELRDVSKLYGEGAPEVRALDGVDLSVGYGALVAVMGPSGSGKSTLLTIAGTLEDPSSGEVVAGGRPVSSLSRNDRARLRRRSIGYVFQDFNLLAGLTALENATLPQGEGGGPEPLDLLDVVARHRQPVAQALGPSWPGDLDVPGAASRAWDLDGPRGRPAGLHRLTPYRWMQRNVRAHHATQQHRRWPAPHDTAAASISQQSHAGA